MSLNTEFKTLTVGAHDEFLCLERSWCGPNYPLGIGFFWLSLISKRCDSSDLCYTALERRAYFAKTCSLRLRHCWHGLQLCWAIIL